MNNRFEGRHGGYEQAAEDEVIAKASVEVLREFLEKEEDPEIAERIAELIGLHQEAWEEAVQVRRQYMDGDEIFDELEVLEEDRQEAAAAAVLNAERATQDVLKAQRAAREVVQDAKEILDGAREEGDMQDARALVEQALEGQDERLFPESLRQVLANRVARWREHGMDDPNKIIEGISDVAQQMRQAKKPKAWSDTSWYAAH